MYKRGDKVTFKVGAESFDYTVVRYMGNTWFLEIKASNNSLIFKKLNIVDRFEFVKSISKYAVDNKKVDFPEIEYPDETEINKVIDALLKKCDEYNKLNNTMSLRYKDGDKIVFKSPNGKYDYHVVNNANNIWFLSNDDGYNDRIFYALKITDKMQFCRDVSGCDVSSGVFPYIRCSDSTGISKIINKLMEMCEEKIKESLKTEEKISIETTSQKPTFKEGDYVRVIFREDVKDSDCYRFGFVEDMLQYCGDIYIVHNVSHCVSEAKSEPDDGMLYHLKTIAGTKLAYNFASSMLMPVRNIIPPQSPFLKQIEFYDSLVTGCITPVDSETKTVSKKSTPEYKLKFTN